MKTSKIILFLFVSLSLILPSNVNAVLAEGLPGSAHITGMTGYAQQYNLSCESRSAVDLAAFYGVHIGEGTFLNQLPRSDNPEVGFVGNPNGSWGQIPPQSYGVHAEPVAALLRAYGLPAEAYKGLSWNNLRAEIAAGRPAIIWVIGRMWNGTPVSYQANDGQTTTVARYEHTMILVGYDQSNVYVINAGTGQKQTYSVSSFLNSWAVLKNMAVIVNSEAPSKSPSTPTPSPPTQSPPASSGGTYTVQRGDYLVSIARKLGISWRDLASVNGLKYPFTVYPGQVLKLPGGSTSNPEPAPAPSPPAEKPPTSQPVSDSKTYTVQRGDYLRKIASMFGVSWDSLAKTNNIQYPYILYPGQVLKISGSSEPPPESPSSPSSGSTVTDAPATYTVQRGEYLVSIARKFGLNWKNLAVLNKLSYPYTVYPGQVIRLR